MILQALFVICLGFISCNDPALKELEDIPSQRERQYSLAMRNAVNTQLGNRNAATDTDGDGDEDPALDMCFEFVFPIDIMLPGGEIITASDDDAIDSIMVAWFMENPEAEEFPELAFPLTITRPDGNTQTIDDEEGLIAIFEECFDEISLECEAEHWGYEAWEEYPDSIFGCFRYIYPITINLPDGTSQVAQSDEQMATIFEAWFEQHGVDSINVPVFQFPIQLQLEGDQVVEVNSDEEIGELWANCFPIELFPEEGYPDTLFTPCVELVFPITVAISDQEAQTAQNEEELAAIYDQWFEEHWQDSSAIPPAFVFPIEVVVEGDMVVIVNSEEGLNELWESCSGEIFEVCFEMVFPITIKFPDGTTALANSQEECDRLFEEWFQNNPDTMEFPEVAYPFDVKFEDGSTETIDNEEAFLALMDQCFGTPSIEPAILISRSARTASARTVLSNRLIDR